jgi:hypothetical protein
VAFLSLKKPLFILDESMPIYSPTGFLDITNATLRTSNLEAQNFKLNGGNIYVTSELTTDELLNLDNVVNAGNATSNTVQFTNLTTGLVADSNIVVTGNVTAGSFLGDGSGLTSIPPSAITGTLSQWSDGTNSDIYIASNVGIGNVHTLTSNTLQVGANLYVRDADANVLTVTGNVAADYFEGDGSKLTGISSNLEQIANNGNVTSNTVQFTNATTGFVTTSNIEVGGALKINTITAAAYHSLQAVTNVGNVTSNTVQFSNATTGLVTTGNVEVGRDLSVTGNLTVLGTRTIVDTDTLRVKDPIIELGKDNPGTGDLGLVMTRPSGSSNVAMIFDESTDTLEIGYTEGSASDTTITMDSTPLSVNVNGTISGNGSGLTALNATNITTGTLDRNTTGSAATLTTPRSIGGVNFDGSADIVPTTFGAATFDTDTLVVDSVNNRVGVGTTNPSAQLHISNGTSGDCVLKIEADTDNSNETDNPRIEFISDGGYNTALVGAGQMPFETANDNALVLAAYQMKLYTGIQDFTDSVNMIERVRIDASGNVGIGTTNPGATLDVNGTARIGGWTTKTWTGNIATSGVNTDINIIDMVSSGTSGQRGEITGELTIMVHRGGGNQQIAYYKVWLNHSKWGSTWYGSTVVLSNSQTGWVGITSVAVTGGSGSANNIGVRIIGNTNTRGAYYIKFEGPIYTPT